MAAWSFQATIGKNPDFDAEESVRALHEAFHSKSNFGRCKKISILI